MTRKQIVSLTIGGIVLMAALLVGRDIALFINPTGLFLVLGGTLGCVFLAFPLGTIVELWTEIKKVNRSQVMDQDKLVSIFVELARTQRKSGARVLEQMAKVTGNQFLAVGVSMVVDEYSPEEIRERLEQEFDFFASRREAQRSILGLMGRLAPAFGLAGTMIGLIRMLHSIKDPTAVSEGMSVALLTTFYGIMLANLVVLPLERKLNERTRAEAVEITLITEGVLGLANEENGAAMAARLNSFRYARGAQLPAGLRLPAKKWLNDLKGVTRFAARSNTHGS